jgi:hypothetical protein
MSGQGSIGMASKHSSRGQRPNRLFDADAQVRPLGRLLSLRTCCAPVNSDVMPQAECTVAPAIVRSLEARERCVRFKASRAFRRRACEMRRRFE